MAALKKQEGNDLFKKGDVEHALVAYKKVFIGLGTFMYN